MKLLKTTDEPKTVRLEWVRCVPGHWKLVRAKTLFKRMQRPVRPEDDVVTCFRDGVVTLRKNRRTSGFTEAIQEIGYQGIRKGDLVIHGMDAFAGAIGVSDSDGKGTPVYSVCQPSQDADPYFYALILREMSRSGYLLSLAKGIRERSTDFRYSDFGALQVPMPPIQEQRIIVRFVRHLDSKFNRLINAKRRLITLLHEQNQAMIHQAVTRGLASTVSLKPSGSAWLGDIPSHWEIKPLLACFVEELVKNEGLSETNVLSLSYGALKRKGIEESKGLVPASYETWQIVKDNSTVLRLTDLQNDHRSLRVAYSTERGIVSSAYLHLVPKMPVMGKFWSLVLSVYDFKKAFYSLGGGCRQGIGLSELKWLPLPVPPLCEVETILQKVDKSLATVENVKSRLVAEISLFEEYRTRLVTDVVTGQLDVNHFDVPAMEASLMELINTEHQEEAEEFEEQETEA